MYPSAVNKGYKTLENEEGFRRCKEIVDEAKERVDEMVCTNLLVICYLIRSRNFYLDTIIWYNISKSLQ